MASLTRVKDDTSGLGWPMGKKDASHVRIMGPLLQSVPRVKNESIRGK